MKTITNLLIVFSFLFFIQSSFGANYFVSTSGNDQNGTGSQTNPWRTIKYAVSHVSANQGHVIHISSGTFVENGPIDIPTGVSLTGSGINNTLIKANSSFYYHPGSPGYSTNKFLFRLQNNNLTAGNQSLKHFTIDGDSKQLHGGIYIRYRTYVLIDSIKVTNTNFNGIWLWDVKDSEMRNSALVNCSWGSTAYSVGALNLGNVERVIIDNCDIDENTGYGIKAIGPSGYNDIHYLQILNSQVSVHPVGLWNNGSAPNIAIELWQVDLRHCEIANCYIDNTVSLVNSNANPSTGVQTIRVHHNYLDMITRAQGAGYAIELTIHDAEIDHNYIERGRYAIANWANPMQNWSIHHNVFYAIEGTYPVEVVRSQWGGLHNVEFYNNTIEFESNKTTNVFGMYGGSSNNITVKNNLLIDSRPSVYSYYPSSFIHLENGATLDTLIVTNNHFYNLPIGSVNGTYSNNTSGVNPLISKTGNRPDPYYTPQSNSPLIDAGVNVSFAYLGSAPDIGAYEYTSSTSTVNIHPNVSIQSPSNNAGFILGDTVVINANASDPDGSIVRVEFYLNGTKLGDDLSAPYTYSWVTTGTGSFSLTAKAIDNKAADSTSSAVMVNVSANIHPSVNIQSPSNNASFTLGDTVVIHANASDPDGSISRVEFYQNGTKLGDDLSAPYTYSWVTNATGSYSLTAKAIDNKAANSTSNAVLVSVSPNIYPNVSIQGPSNNASFFLGDTVVINANASDPDGNIARVEFYLNGAKLGDDLSAPYTYSWVPGGTGSYSLTAKAIDNKTAISTSNAVMVNVSSKIITPPPSGYIRLGLDASDATLRGIMTYGSDPAANKKTFFYIPQGNGSNYYIPPPARATFNFKLSKSDSYEIWARVKSDGIHQNYFVYDGNGKWSPWKTGTSTTWKWVKITNAYTRQPVKFSFVAGLNSFALAWGHENVKIDRVLITNDENESLIFDPESSESEQSEILSMVVYPNPANNFFTIKHEAPQFLQAQITISRSDRNHIESRSVVLNKGINQFSFQTESFPPGTYIVSLTTAKYVLAEKLILIK